LGQTTSADALDEARDALADVADVEITVTVSELSTEARRWGPRITRVEQGGQPRDLRGRQRQAPC
jgi:hypothetical protein